MKKAPKTDVYELVKAIDSELNAKEAILTNRADELQILQDRIAAEKLELETAQAEFQKEKAGFDVLKAEVEAKLNKIRSDEKLSEDLRAQAITAKAVEEQLKEAKEERGLAVLTLEEVAKREAAVSEREKNYKEELKKEFAASIFKG